VHILILIAFLQIISNILENQGFRLFKHQFPIWLLLITIFLPAIESSFFCENVIGGCGSKCLANPILFWWFGAGFVTLFIRYIFLQSVEVWKSK